MIFKSGGRRGVNILMLQVIIQRGGILATLCMTEYNIQRQKLLGKIQVSWQLGFEKERMGVGSATSFETYYNSNYLVIYLIVVHT